MGEVGERELLAIIFTDAVGSSSQTAQDEDKSLSMLMADLDFIRNEAGVRGGSVLKNTGDGLLISFKSAVDAVECALAIQKSFQSRPKGSGFQHKIGVHIGDVIKKDGDIYGAGVNTASRLVDQCGAGGICISSTLFELTKQKSEIGKLKLQNFLLQNTEPPTLAYKSVEGGKINEKVEAPVTEKKKKSMLVYAGICAFALLLGPFFIPQVRATLLKALFNPTQKYGFRFTTQEVIAPKSKPGATGIEFTLENATDLMLELKWLEPDGRAKPSDFRAEELLRMSPKGDPIEGRTGEGHVFEIWNVIADQRLGYLHFLSGTNLCLIVKEKDGGVTVLPKNFEDAEKGEPRAQARLAKAFYFGEGVPQNYKEAFDWAKKSSKQNCSEGLLMLAQMYEEGRGTHKDTILASVLRTRADAITKK